MGEKINNPQERYQIDSGDTRLIRAARRIIRLYDLGQDKMIRVKAESVAEIIAEELNNWTER